jgi:hypothetical protein
MRRGESIRDLFDDKAFTRVKVGLHALPFHASRLSQKEVDYQDDRQGRQQRLG